MLYAEEREIPRHDITLLSPYIHLRTIAHVIRLLGWLPERGHWDNNW